MKHLGLSDSEVIAAWQHRVGMYRVRVRRAGLVALGLVIVGVVLYGVSFFVQEGWKYLARGLVILLVFGGVAPLQIYAISLYGLLRCPRCGFPPGTFGSRRNRINATICEHCFVPLTGPMQPNPQLHRSPASGLPPARSAR